jgi:hypothetical protein
MGTDKPRDRELEGYAWVEFVEVQDNRRLPLPEKVQDALQNEPDLRHSTPYINWGYDESNDSSWMVLSKYPLKKDGYTSIDRSDIDRPNYTTSYIRPKEKVLDEFPDQLSDAFNRTDTKFAYIATEQMIDDNPSSWLVERWKLLQMLPHIDAGDEIPSILDKNPGLIPDF